MKICVSLMLGFDAYNVFWWALPPLLFFVNNLVVDVNEAVNILNCLEAEQFKARACSFKALASFFLDLSSDLFWN